MGCVSWVAEGHVPPPRGIRIRGGGVAPSADRLSASVRMSKVVDSSEGANGGGAGDPAAERRQVALDLWRRMLSFEYQVPKRMLPRRAPRGRRAGSRKAADSARWRRKRMPWSPNRP